MVKFTPKNRLRGHFHPPHCEIAGNGGRTAAKVDISRNELINQCIEFALENLELPE